MRAIGHLLLLTSFISVLVSTGVQAQPFKTRSKPCKEISFAYDLNTKVSESNLSAKLLGCVETISAPEGLTLRGTIWAASKDVLRILNAKVAAFNHARRVTCAAWESSYAEFVGASLALRHPLGEKQFAETAVVLNGMAGVGCLLSKAVPPYFPFTITIPLRFESSEKGLGWRLANPEFEYAPFTLPYAKNQIEIETKKFLGETPFIGREWGDESKIGKLEVFSPNYKVENQEHKLEVDFRLRVPATVLMEMLAKQLQAQ